MAFPVVMKRKEVTVFCSMRPCVSCSCGGDSKTTMLAWEGGGTKSKTSDGAQDEDETSSLEAVSLQLGSLLCWVHHESTSDKNHTTFYLERSSFTTSWGADADPWRFWLVVWGHQPIFSSLPTAADLRNIVTASLHHMRVHGGVDGIFVRLIVCSRHSGRIAQWLGNSPSRNHQGVVLVC